jgi:hypothetical protein
LSSPNLESRNIKTIYVYVNKKSNVSFFFHSDHQFIVLWQYRTTQTSMNNIKFKKDKKININDIGATEVLNDLDRNGFRVPVENAVIDKICGRLVSFILFYPVLVN